MHHFQRRKALAQKRGEPSVLLDDESVRRARLFFHGGRRSSDAGPRLACDEPCIQSQEPLRLKFVSCPGQLHSEFSSSKITPTRCATCSGISRIWATTCRSLPT